MRRKKLYRLFTPDISLDNPYSRALTSNNTYPIQRIYIYISVELDMYVCIYKYIWPIQLAFRFLTGLATFYVETAF